MLWVIPAKQPHLPLYYVLLHGWTAVAGTSETALRAPSAVFGIISLPLIYLVGRHMFDRETGLVATVVLAVSPFHLYYAQETRMYSFLTATTLLSFLFLLRLRETPSRANVAGYVTGTMLTVALHPFGFLVVVAQGLALVADRWRSGGGWRPGEFSTLERTHLACWGLLTPVLALGVLKARSAVDGFDFIAPPTPADVVWTVHEYFSTTATPAAMLVGVLVVVAVLLAFRTLDRDRVLLVAWMLVPVLALVAVSYLLTPLFWDRYTIAASPAWFLAVALGITSLERRHARYALAGLLIAAMVPAVGHYYTTPQKEEWDAVTAEIETHAEPGDVVIVTDDVGRQAFDHYWSRSDVTVEDAVAGPAPGGGPVTNATEFQRLTHGSDRVWLVLTHIWFHPGEKQRVLDAVDDGRDVVRHRDYFGVELYLFANESDDRS
nr:glycosyltransferase family 39 protein [Halorientalis brevis]